MYRNVLFSLVLFIGFVVCPVSEISAQSQKDMVCQGSCGGGCGPCPGSSSGGGTSLSAPRSSKPSTKEQIANYFNKEGLAAYNKKEWVKAASSFKKSLQVSKNDPVVLRNLANAQTHAGIDAYNEGDYSKALSYFQQALTNDPPNDPDNHFIVEDIAAAQGKIADTQRESLKDAVRDPDRRSDTEVKRAGTTAVRGTFGESVEQPNLATVAPPPEGTDKHAGDQVLAAAQANSAEDVKRTYDTGGSKNAGSLVYVGNNSPVDLSNYSEKARKDPRVIEMVNQIGALKEKRNQLDLEYDQILAKFHKATTKAEMDKISIEMNKKQEEKDGNLAAIVEKKIDLERIHREINTKVAPAPKE